MQGNVYVLSLSYPGIKFIHFELAVLSDSWISLVPVVSVSTSTMFFLKNHQQVSVYLSILFPSNIVSF